MAKRGSTKWLSVKHEEFIARLYGGKRSPSSGAASTDAGDVRLRDEGTLFECKLSGGPGRVKSTTLLRHMEKAAEEAYEEGKEPAIALRYFNPDSILSNHEGWVDLTVRLTQDDATRSRKLNGN